MEGGGKIYMPATHPRCRVAARILYYESEQAERGMYLTLLHERQNII